VGRSIVAALAAAATLALGALPARAAVRPAPLHAAGGQGVVRVVAPWGSDRAPGTPARPWLTPQHAADVARAGTTVFIRRGRYGPFDIWRSGRPGAPIEFAAYPRERAVFAGARRRGDVLRVEHVHDVVLSGLVVQGAMWRWGAGIRLVDATDVVVRGCTLQHNHSFGIEIADSRRVTLRDCAIRRNDTGVQVTRGGAGIGILDNRIAQNDGMVVNDPTPGNDRGANAIVLYRTSGHLEIAGNVIHGNRARSHDWGHDGGAFEIFGASDVAIHDNVVWNNQNVMETGTDGSRPCSRISFYRNVAYGLTRVRRSAMGLILRCAEDSSFTGNTLVGLDLFSFDVAASGQAFGGSIAGLRIEGNRLVATGSKVYSIDSWLPASVRIDGDHVTKAPGRPVAWVADQGHAPSLETLTRWTGLERHGVQLPSGR
jgi:parallel beta-helix repeat protein